MRTPPPCQVRRALLTVVYLALATPLFAAPLTSIQLQFVNGGKRHAASHGGTPAAAPSNLILLYRQTPTQTFVAPVTAEINGLAFTDVILDAQGVLTLAGTPGGDALDAALPTLRTATITIRNGDGARFTLLVTRTAQSITVTAPALDNVNSASVTPASTLALTGQHFSEDPASNDIAFILSDGRVFHARAKRASNTSLDVVMPFVLTTDQRAFYSGDVAITVATAPGYSSRPISVVLAQLPQLSAAPGSVIAQLAQNLQELADATAPAVSAALSQDGLAPPDIQYLQTFPRAAIQNLRDLSDAALSGHPRTFDIPTGSGVQRVTVDAAAIALFERLLLSSNAIVRTQAATRRYVANTITTQSVCGPTAAETHILDAEHAWEDADFSDDLLTCAELMATAIVLPELLTAGTATFAVPAVITLIGAAHVAELVSHILIGHDYIELQSIGVDREIHISGGTKDVPIIGIFQSPALGATLKEEVAFLVEQSVATWTHIPDVVVSLVVQGIESTLDFVLTEEGKDITIPHAPTGWTPLSLATTQMNIASSAVAVTGPCPPDNLAHLTTTSATSQRIPFTVRSDKFSLMTQDGVSNVVTGTIVIDSVPKAPIAAIDATSGGASAKENGTLNVSVDAGAKATVTVSAARSSDPQGQSLTYAWKLDGSLIATDKQTSVSVGVGAHAMTLQVTDAAGLTGTTVLYIAVTTTAAPLTAGFTMTAGTSSATEGHTLSITTGAASTMVTLSGIRSVDPSGQGLTYAWVVGAVSLSGLDVVTPLPPGTFSVTLTVTDHAQRRASATGTIVITLGQGVAPVIDGIDPTVTAISDFSATLKGSGFDATTVIGTITGPSCIPACTVATTDFLSRSSSALLFTAHAWAAGAYRVSVRNGAVGVPSNIVTVTVTGANSSPCTLSVQPPTISAAASGGERQATNVSITCVGSSGVRWSLANPSVAWLSTSSLGGDIPGATTIVLDSSKASIGLNSASLVFSSSASTGSATLPVTLTVSTGSNSVGVVPLAWQVPYFVGDKAVSLPFKITSSDGSPLTGTISASTMGPWPLAQLTLNGKQDYSWVAPESVTVTADPAGLGAGTYTGSLTISAPSATNPLLTIPVTMTIYLPLQIVTTSLPQATTGHAYSATLVASGGSGGNTWTIESGALPSGLTLGSQDGTITGTPTGQGSSSFTVTVHDSAGHAKSASFTISTQASVGMSDLAPSNTQWILGSVYTKSGTACFGALGGTPPYTWSATGMPPGLSIDGGCVVGAPTQIGTFIATITVTDATPTQASRQHGFVVSANALRIADGSGSTPPALPNGTVGAAYSSYVQAFGGDSTSYQWTVQGTLPPGITSQNGPGCPSSCALFFVGTPTTANTYTFSVTVKDSLGGPVQQAVAIIINSGTPPAITTSKLPAATVGSGYSTSLTASGGSGAGYKWTFTNGSPDPGLSLSSAGVLSGTPTLPNDCSGGSSDGIGGVYLPSAYPSTSFQVQVTDSAGQSQTKNLCLVSYYPTPHVTSIVPNTVTVDGAAKSITVNGTNFRPDAYAISTTLQQMASTSVTATVLQFTLAPQFSPLYNGSPGLLDVGAATFKVVQPYSQPSNADQTLTVFAPAPALTSVQAVLTANGQPCYINVNCQLNVTGSGLYVGTLYKIKETGATLTRGSNPSTQVWTQGTTSGFSVTSAGTYTLQIMNPNQPNGGSATAEETFTVNGLNDVTVVPSSWQFGTFVGDPTVSLPFKISSSVGATLTGTVSTATTAPWPSAQLKVNGQSTYSWVAPETVTVTTDSAGLSAGTYTGSLTITAPSASNSPVTVPITMTVYNPLQITTASLPQAIAGQAYSATLAATGGSGGFTWSLDGGALPTGLSLNTAGAITGTPSGQGTSTFTVGVHDSVGHSKQAGLSISTTPSVGIGGISPSNIQWIIGTTYTQGGTGCFSAVGGTPPYTWSATGMPPGLTINAGCVVGTPSQTGTFNATIKVTDATPTQATTAYTFTVTANPLRVADSAGHTPPALPSGTVGVAYSSYVQAFGGDPSSYQWTVQGTLPPGISSQNGPGCPSACVLVFTGTPTTANSYNFNVTVKDSLGGSLQQAVTIVINSGTPPSIDTGKMPAATVGSAYSTTLAASGGSGSGYQWSFTNGSPDPGLTLSSAGLLSGTPTLPNDCNGGSSDGIGGGWVDAQHPSKSFQVKVTDSAGQSNTKNLCLVSYYPTPQVTGLSPATITMDNTAKTITVNGANFRPDAYALSTTFQQMVSTSVTATALQFTLNPQFSPYYVSGTGTVNEGVTPFKVIQAWSNASNADKTLTVYAPVPTVSSVQAVLGNGQPCYINVNCVLNISGSGFYIGTTYKIKETGATMNRSSAPNTQVWTTVTTTAFSVTTAGTYTLQLTNANQAGGGSVTVEQTFTVNGL